MKLSYKNLEIMKIIDKYNYVVRSKQKFYSTLGYNLAIWFLRDIGIIEENGINKRREKRWIFTEKGRKIMNHLKEIEKLTEVN